MKKVKWNTVTTILVVLVIFQAVFFYLFYTFQQDTTDGFVALQTNMQQNDQALQVGMEQLGESLQQTNTHFTAEIDNTKKELGERIFDLEADVEANKAEFSSQLTQLEQSQEQTASTLEKSIRNLQLSNQDFSGIIEDVLPSVVSVLTNEGQGSGVIVDRDGLVMTNDHVIEGASVVRVLTYDGQVHAVDVVGRNPVRDLAVLNIRGGDTYDRLTFEDDYVVGQNVIAIGNPGGLGFSVTEGIISSVERRVDGLDFVQISNSINPGNSGGPLLDIEGNVVGINTLKITGFEGVGFAIPADEAQDMLSQVKNYLASLEAS
jgi:S1-C subfamily serine protease